MKIVQIGNSGHAKYAYNGIKKYGIEFSGISCGTHGLENEGIEAALPSLEKYGFSPRVYGDYKEMLSAEKPDIAIVNPWFNDNGAIALYALEKGIHVFCEKPVATDIETLEKLEACAKNGEAVLAPMFESRYMSEFITAKKAIDEGKVGTIRMMDSRKSYKLGKRPEFYSSREYYCGIIPWVAIHAIDWMSWLSGEKYTSVSAIHSCKDNGGNGDMDIIASAQFKMTNDIIATLNADMYRPSVAKSHGDDRVRIVGTDGIIEVANGEATLLSDAYGEIKLPKEEPKDIFEDFLALIRGEKNDLTAKSAIEATKWALLADLDACSK